jgi:hypothetical protein
VDIGAHHVAIPIDPTVARSVDDFYRGIPARRHYVRPSPLHEIGNGLEDIFKSDIIEPPLLGVSLSQLESAGQYLLAIAYDGASLHKERASLFDNLNWVAGEHPLMAACSGVKAGWSPSMTSMNSN